jgi:hypothetical protein
MFLPTKVDLRSRHGAEWLAAIWRIAVRGSLLLTLSVVFLWPAVMNHGPFYFVDTRTYIRTEDAALAKVLHTRTDWTTADGSSVLAPQQSYLALHNAGESHTRSLAEIKEKGIVLGRSLFWGLLAYAGWRSGFWLTIFLQAASLILLLWLCLRALQLPVWRCIFPLGVLLAVLSDAGFYASFVMPDLYAGVAIVCLGILLTDTSAATRWRTWPWFGMLIWCLLAHDSLLLLDAACLGMAIVVNLFAKDWRNRRGLLVAGAALCVAMVCQQGIAVGIRHVTAQEPLRFPLIAARLIEDGPGTTYLRKSCPASGFALCAYVDKLPLSASDFLFCTKPECAAYEVAGYERRSQISKEQTRFMMAVFRNDPVGFVRADLKDTWEELLNLGMGPFFYSESIKKGMDLTFPHSVLEQIHRSAAYRGTWPVGVATVWVYLVTGLSLLYIVLQCFGWLPGRDAHPMMVAMGLWCCVGVLVNAAICGALSEPAAGESRYQGRVVWVLPLAVLLSEAAGFVERRKLCRVEAAPWT